MKIILFFISRELVGKVTQHAGGKEQGKGHQEFASKDGSSFFRGNLRGVVVAVVVIASSLGVSPRVGGAQPRRGAMAGADIFIVIEITFIIIFVGERGIGMVGRAVFRHDIGNRTSF